MEAAEQLQALRGIAVRLVQQGKLDREQALAASEAATREQSPFVTHLVRSKQLSGREIAEISAAAYGLPLFDLDSVNVDSLPLTLADADLVRKHRAIPLSRRGQRIFVGLSDPTNLKGLEELRFHTGLTPELILVEDDKLDQLLEKAVPESDSMLSDLSAEELGNLDNIGIDEEPDKESEAYDATKDAPVVRFVNKILLDAINQGASDIHFEPFEKYYRIRYRVDGLLHDVTSPPINMAGRLASRLKVMARLNIAEKRLPQDGRVRLKLSKQRNIDFRVNSCPTLYGEKIVLRILESQFSDLDVSALGMTELQRKAYMQAVTKPYGMILVTGPTGSGKTVTLYSALHTLNEARVNISTVEDPVEIQMPGINQVNVNPKAGLNFADALRSFLRQDPDIIMVGEIRDLETAEIAIKAAQTGHLVLSTLHTNDAPQSVTRLANMGIPAYNIAASVLLIMAQRLVRVLCPNCKKEDPLPSDVMRGQGFTDEDIAEGLTIYRAVGCEQCTEGYRGRTGVFQVMPMSADLERLILDGGTTMQLEQQAKTEGIWDLRTAGLAKVRAGITSLEELNRVTKD
jgi:type IV pilus assembly protein PilB